MELPTDDVDLPDAPPAIAVPDPSVTEVDVDDSATRAELRLGD